MSEDFLPSADEAQQFAVMLSAGMPAEEAILYFLEDPENAVMVAARWVKSAAVRSAVTTIQGSRWQDLSLDDAITFALDKSYREKAYYLYSRNYTALSGADLTKYNTARSTLEVKKAGLAGKTEPLAKFWDDVKSGKVKLNTPAIVPSVKVESKH